MVVEAPTDKVVYLEQRIRPQAAGASLAFESASRYVAQVSRGRSGRRFIRRPVTVRVEHVTALSAIEPVVAWSPVEPIVLGASQEHVVAFPTTEEVLAAKTDEAIVAAEANDNVGVRCPTENVGAARANLRRLSAEAQRLSDIRVLTGGCRDL
jgi:hypothetical protein